MNVSRLVSVIACAAFCCAQVSVAEERIQLHRLSASEAISVDGELSEPIWNQLTAYDRFVIIEPDTLQRGRYETQIRFAYDDDGLYVGAYMEQPPETRIKRLSGRDVRQLNRDNINITIDTSGEGRYGFWFGINLGGSQMDGTVLPEREFSNEWDGPWRGETAETETGWTAEFFIPWGAVAMPQTGSERHLGFYMSRKVAHLDERWGWPGLADTKPQFMSALEGMTVRDVAPRQQYNIYPFTAVTADRIDDEVRYRVGADVFWRPSSNFQLNATVNPDFGNAESDDVVINLTATETFFPEKRLFFVEGQELFSATPRSETRNRGVGRTGTPITMVNTRRIGGRPQDPNLPMGATISQRESVRPVELVGAARVTGEFGKFRYGVMSAFEEEVKFNAVLNGQDVNLYQDGSDYALARLLYQNNDHGDYRAVGVIATHASHYDGDADAAGLDWHYLSPKGKFKMDGQVFRSDLDHGDTGYGGFVDFEFDIRQGVRQRVGLEHFDEHVDINDLGFLSRNDYTQIRTAHTRTTSNISWARNNQFDARTFLQRNGDRLFTRGGVFLSNRTTFNNLSTWTARLGHIYPGYDDLNSFGNGAYRIHEKTSASLRFRSNSARALSYGFQVAWDEEDLSGQSYTLETELNWRPNDQFSVSLVNRYTDRNGWLLHQEGRNFTTFDAKQWVPRLNLDYFITARQQLRLSFQWVAIRAREQDFYLIPAKPGNLIPTAKPPGPPDSFSISDMVLQLRYRWEIAPLSDLFVVYGRGSDLAQALGRSQFNDLLDDAWNNPIANQLVVKLRYRFGS